MPIGKNALKRVSNNGYSKVNTSAPDMEHSEIALDKAEPIEAVSHKASPKRNTTPKEKKPSVKKPATEKAVSKKVEKKPAVKIEEKLTDKAENKLEDKHEEITHPDGFVRYGVGENLPAHLL